MLCSRRASSRMRSASGWPKLGGHEGSGAARNACALGSHSTRVLWRTPLRSIHLQAVRAFVWAREVQRVWCGRAHRHRSVPDHQDGLQRQHNVPQGTGAHPLQTEVSLTMEAVQARSAAGALAHSIAVHDHRKVTVLRVGPRASLTRAKHGEVARCGLVHAVEAQLPAAGRVPRGTVTPRTGRNGLRAHGEHTASARSRAPSAACSPRRRVCQFSTFIKSW